MNETASTLWSGRSLTMGHWPERSNWVDTLLMSGYTSVLTWREVLVSYTGDFPWLKLSLNIWSTLFLGWSGDSCMKQDGLSMFLILSLAKSLKVIKKNVLDGKMKTSKTTWEHTDIEWLHSQLTVESSAANGPAPIILPSVSSIASGMDRRRRVCPVGAVSKTTTENCSSWIILQNRRQAGWGGTQRYYFWRCCMLLSHCKYIVGSWCPPQQVNEYKCMYRFLVKLKCCSISLTKPGQEFTTLVVCKEVKIKKNKKDAAF